ncbi:hypothetical protein HG531_003667 [Fusarium graminearum]|nr:hypothetical protein HG531_003667 [Fusarium graminearum]
MPTSASHKQRRKSPTYHLVQPKHLLALGCQINLCDSNLPPVIAPTALGTLSSPNDLVSEANTHDAHAIRCDGLFRVLYQLEDPRVVVERRVSGASDEDRIDVLDHGVRVQLVNDVVALDGDELRQLFGLGRCFEERGKDACVTAITIAGLRLGRIGFEDGETKRRHFEQDL